MKNHWNFLMVLALLAILLGGNPTPARADTVVAVDDYYTVHQGETLVVPAPGALANDILSPSVQLATPYSSPSHGSLDWHSNGSFSYTPEPGFTGVDSFQYVLEDYYTYVDRAYVYITVLPAADSTPPVITSQIDGVLGQNGWYVSDVTLTWTVRDEESELTAASGCDPVVITADQPAAAYTCQAASAGGASSQSASIQRDATPPVVAVTGVSDGASYLLGVVPAAGCSTSDSMSGVAAEAGLTLTGGSPLGAGAFTAACAGAVDIAGNAGNTASAQYNVAFLFTGFTAPVENPDVMNIAKAGQTIPLKWRLLDANGNPVTELAGVTVTAVTLSCSTGTTTDQIEEYAAGNSGLQNLGNGYYQWNWKTPKSYANSCKTLKLDLGEGIGFEHTALFQFKK